MSERLKLLAADTDDLAVMATVTQDALVSVGEMVFAAEEKKFYAALNRFCWEKAAKTGPYQRTHSGLCIEQVERVQLRNIDFRQPGQVFNLLTIFFSEGWLHLNFAGRRDVRLQVAGLSCRLNDFGEVWSTVKRPQHRPEGWTEWQPATKQA